jgi:hypothetical protein
MATSRSTAKSWRCGPLEAVFREQRLALTTARSAPRPATHHQRRVHQFGVGAAEDRAGLAPKKRAIASLTHW